MANEAMAGVDSGSTIFRKMRKWLAPSTRAASNRSRGSWAMKLCSRNTASGSANIVCAIHTGRYGHLMMESFPAMGTVGMCTPKSSKCPVKSCRSGQQRHLQRDDLQREDGEEDERRCPGTGSRPARTRPSTRSPAGTARPGIVIMNEFTKNGTEPPRAPEPPPENARSSSCSSVNDGCVNHVHQPLLCTSVCGRIEVMNRPSVGIVHRTVMMTTIDRRHGELNEARMAADGAFLARPASGAATVMVSPMRRSSRRHAPSAAGRCCTRARGMTPMNRMTASALPRPKSNCVKICVYISLASTSVPKLPPVVVRTMSKIFRTAIRIVVSTTTRVLRIIGIVTVLNSAHAGRAVERGRLDDVAGDRLDGRGQDHHREAGLDPDHDHHEQERVERLPQQPVRRVLPAQPDARPGRAGRSAAATGRGSRRRTSR